jgi:hypothetical protein
MSLCSNFKIFMKTLLSYLLFVTYLLFFFSCKEKYSSGVVQSLELAGDNKEEIEKVIAHYQKEKNDSLKLKAALFLIDNMKYHSGGIKLTYADSLFNNIALLKIKNTIDNDNRAKLIEKKIDSLNTLKSIDTFSEPSNNNDVEHLSAAFLINNIDLAFEAWYRIPQKNRANFSDFCNFVLPYRNYKEPVSINERKMLFLRYAWVYDSLSRGVSFDKIVNQIKQEVHIKILLSIRSKYPQTLSVIDMDKLRVGLCTDAVTYFVHLFRALGIPAANDYVPHLGNHPTFGHDWLFLKYGNTPVYTDAALDKRDPKYLFPVLKEDALPKVFRRLFAKQSSSQKNAVDQDVTLTYQNVYSPNILVEFNKDYNGNARVFVFDYNKEWASVDEVVLKNGYAHIKNISKNVVFLVGYFDNQEFFPLSYPFTFDKVSNSIKYLKPNNITVDSVILDRKYPLYTKRYQYKRKLLAELNGCVFEGANNESFSNKKVIHTIKGHNSTQVQKVKIEDKNIFKYVRFYSSKPDGFITELRLFDKNGKQIFGRVIKSDTSFSNNINDNKAETYFGGAKGYIGLQLDNPSSIGYIEYQSRHDGNHISKGDTYELSYWDQKWQVHSTIQATDTVLYLNNIPASALFILKNVTTKGKESHVFAIKKNKRQQWIGSHYD